RRLGWSFGRLAAFGPVVARDADLEPGQLDARAIARTDQHRPRMQPAVREADVMGRRDRARELAEDARCPREIDAVLLDELGERRGAVAFEHDRLAVDREPAAHRPMIDRPDPAQPGLER